MVTLLGYVLLVLAIVVAVCIHNDNVSGLKNIPNAHFSAPYSRLWIIWTQWRKIENRTRVDLHRRLGPVVRVGPREVSVNCIDGGIRTTYSAKFDKDKSMYSVFMDNIPFMFTMIGNDEHKKRKRMLSHVYSKSYILNSLALENVLASASSRLKEKLTLSASTRSAIDAILESKCYAVDVTSGWLFGTEDGVDKLQDPYLVQDDISAIVKTTFDGLFWRTNFPTLTHWFKRIHKIVRPDSSILDRWAAWSDKVNANAFEKYSSGYGPASTVYEFLWDAFKADNPSVSYNDAGPIIAAECEDHLVASHQGLGIALTYAMYELSQNPDVQKMLRQELLTLAQEGGEKQAIRIEKLPVLDAIVTETLRAHTPGLGPFPRVVPETGCRLAGAFDVPGGTVVSTSAWALHYNPIPYPSPEEWRPQRWLEADDEKLAEMKKWFWAFGSGPRACIGVHLAMRVIKDFLVTVYTDYETYLEEGVAVNMQQVDFTMALAWPVASEVKIKVRRAA